MPPKPVVRMAGGRRVAKGRRTGPSAEKAKLYRQDDKERLKKAAKKDKGGLRNDNSSGEGEGEGYRYPADGVCVYP